MSRQPESEQLQNFHESLSKWISSQGVWFQLRYSLQGVGSRGGVFQNFMKLGVRLLIFLVVLGVVGSVVFLKQYGGKGFLEDVSNSIQEKLSSEQIAMNGVGVDRGVFRIGKLGLIGGEDTFFETLRLTNLRCRMGFLDRFREEWDAGMIEISDLEIELRPGADSEKSALAIAEVLFQEAGRMKMGAIQVEDTTLRWGYSEKTRGSIAGSNMRAQKSASGWTLKFQGGLFSQNWLKNLEIMALEVTINEEGITLDKARFKSGKKGQVSLDGMHIRAGDRPILDGVVRLEGVALENLVPVIVQEYIEGTVSGVLSVFGSVNTTKGVGYEGDFQLAANDSIILRDRIPLLRALSVIDKLREYRRVELGLGSMHFKSHAGKVEFSKVNLIADETLSLQGEMSIRIPTDQEITAFTEFLATKNAGGDSLFGGVADESFAMSLGKAAEGEVGVGFSGEIEVSLFDRLELLSETRREEQKAAELRFQTFQYEGDLSLILKDSVFGRAPELATFYPSEGLGKGVRVDVPIEGTLEQLTQEQADQFYLMGRSR